MLPVCHNISYSGGARKGIRHKLCQMKNTRSYFFFLFLFLVIKGAAESNFILNGFWGTATGVDFPKLKKLNNDTHELLNPAI